MAENPSETSVKTIELGETSTTTALLEKLTQLLILQQSPSSTTPSTEGSAPPISVKLDGTNYGLWSQVVEMHIKGRDKLRHITGVPGEPLPTDPLFRKWSIDDSIVKGWLINSLEPRLIGNFIRFPTAKDVWDAIATTFFDGNDASLVYDLNKRVAKLKQEGGPVEGYYRKLQTLWREIDFRCPNPMEHSTDIERFNSYIQESRVYTFLDGLDDRLDNVRADVLQMNPFPTVEQAFARVRREEMHQVVMVKGDEVGNNSMALVLRGYKPAEVNLTFTKPGQNYEKTQTKYGCTHCGGSKHTRENCFKLIGYPDWWKEQKKRKQDGKKGRTTVVISGPAEPNQKGNNFGSDQMTKQTQISTGQAADSG